MLPALQVEYNYTGPQKSEHASHMAECNPKGPLVMHICKLLPKSDASGFDAFGRIFSGTVKPGDRVRVLGEAYSPEDEEDSVVAVVSKIWIFQAQYRVPINSAAAGKSFAHLKFTHLTLHRIWMQTCIAICKWR